MNDNTKIIIGCIISILVTIISIPFLMLPFVNMGMLFILFYYFYIPLYEEITMKKAREVFE